MPISTTFSWSKEVVKNQIEKMQEIYTLQDEDVSIETFKA